MLESMFVRPEESNRQLVALVGEQRKEMSELLDGMKSANACSYADVVRIQDNLVSDADYVPPDECPCAVGAKLDMFLPATGDEVKLIVAKSPSKSLDPVPTWMLKAQI